jgi:polyhydroxyalkanoate synthesis regulator phasin
MLEGLKKTIYAGIGATVISAERLGGVLDELVEKGKLSSKDAQDLAKKIADEGRKEFDESSTRIGTMLDEWLRKANFAREKDLQELKERVAKLEAAQGTAPAPQETRQPQ